MPQRSIARHRGRLLAAALGVLVAVAGCGSPGAAGEASVRAAALSAADAKSSAPVASDAAATSASVAAAAAAAASVSAAAAASRAAASSAAASASAADQASRLAAQRAAEAASSAGEAPAGAGATGEGSTGGATSGPGAAGSASLKPGLPDSSRARALALVAAAAPAPPADPDATGPEGGAACPSDPGYYDESTEGLQADLAAAWVAIVEEATAAGVALCLNDGKRSRAQQQAQYDTYAAQYGPEVADQLVLPPDRSAHVLGVAVDVQPAAAHNWLERTDGRAGFCRTYDNEPWHFEYDPIWAIDGCPARQAKPTG